MTYKIILHFQRNQRKINDLESRQRQIEASFKHLRHLKQELTCLNNEAQFHNAKIHAFLSAFIPDYRLVQEPNLVLDQKNDQKKEKEEVDKNDNVVAKIPRVQIDFKYETDPSVKQRLPIPTVTYEWSDYAEKMANGFPTYLPRLGNGYLRHSKLNWKILFITFQYF